jgi:exopolyphosphatase/guanosine-5'-triphosphate,3'-diphosphate pyrophosphatase
MPSDCLAAVDMGTNSFHLIIVKLKKDGSFKVIDKEKEVIRLGSHEGKDLSVISSDEIKSAVKILSRFKKLAQYYDAKMRAVATSAVRESHNQNEFLEAVFKSTGIEVEIIKGRHEAELIYRGAKKALPLENKKVLCIDIGGGSTEFVFGNKGKPVSAESIKVGAVRLSKKFFPDFLISEIAVKECEKYIGDHLKSRHNLLFDKGYDFAVGSSGTIQSVAAMIHYFKNHKPIGNLNGVTFSKKELYSIVDQILMKTTTEERLKIKGLEPKRADIIPAGILILKKAFELFKLKDITISEFALREGIILEMLDKFDK